MILNRHECVDTSTACACCMKLANGRFKGENGIFTTSLNPTAKKKMIYFQDIFKHFTQCRVGPFHAVMIPSQPQAKDPCTNTVWKTCRRSAAAFFPCPRKILECGGTRGARLRHDLGNNFVTMENILK